MKKSNTNKNKAKNASLQKIIKSSLLASALVLPFAGGAQAGITDTLWGYATAPISAAKTMMSGGINQASQTVKTLGSVASLGTNMTKAGLNAFFGTDESSSQANAALVDSFKNFKNSLWGHYDIGHKTWETMVTEHPIMALSSSVALNIALTTAGYNPLAVNGVMAMLTAPTWSDVPGQFARSMMATSLTGGIFKAASLWAPFLRDNTAFNIATPLVSSMVSKSGLSGIVTTAKWAKDNPSKALAAGILAGAVGYYAVPELIEKIKELGDGPLSTTRAIIDNGSGAIKGSVITYNPFTGKLVGDPIKLATNLSTSLSKAIQADKTLPDDAIERGISAIKDLVSKAQELGVHPSQISGVATAWAREAENAPDYLKRVLDETGVKLSVVTQQMEGEFGASAAKLVSNIPTDATIFDAGGGSTQATFKVISSPNINHPEILEEDLFLKTHSLVESSPLHTTSGEKSFLEGMLDTFGMNSGDYQVYGTTQASETFKQTTEKYFGLSPDTVWDTDTIKKTVDLAEKVSSASNTAGSGMGVLKSIQSQAQGGARFAIGNVYNGVLKMVQEMGGNSDRVVTVSEIDTVLKNLSGKTGKDIADILVKKGVNSFAAANAMTNLSLVKGLMQTYGIDSVDVLNTESGTGAFFNETVWKHLVGTPINEQVASGIFALKDKSQKTYAEQAFDAMSSFSKSLRSLWSWNK